jgi:hypothetical protein
VLTPALQAHSSRLAQCAVSASTYLHKFTT